MSETDFIAAARRRYVEANAATLRWMIGRPPLGMAFLNTKMNSLTLADYGPEDGGRGPDFTYGWIQGRGLEALATHAGFFAHRDPALAEALDEKGRALYQALAALQAADGHAYFCYDKQMRPVYFESTGSWRPQHAAGRVFTYSDAFVAKGLVAGAARYAPADLPARLDYLAAVIAAIEDWRFQMQEDRPLSTTTAGEQPADFGPRMILLGAAGLLQRVGEAQRAAFAPRFIEHVLEHHFDPRTGLLANVPGQDACNVGHAIEFVGFALEFLGRDCPASLRTALCNILEASFRLGFVGPGITLAVSIETGRAGSPYCPWWSLPESIRAAALCHVLTEDPKSLGIWQAAHAAFFERYWRGEPAIAYQTLTEAGPVDYVPATPDLDPGYHTGLSLLAAIEAGAA
jgi:hypothetical protein